MCAMSVEEYLQLPYTIEVIRDNNPENPGWVARVVELPGCITQGDTFEELGEMIRDAMRGWIEVALEDGEDIPEPRREEEFSGKFIVRVSKSLHRRLVMTAEREGISLNQFVSTALSGAVVSFAGGELANPMFSPDESRAWIKEAVKETFRELEIIPETKLTGKAPVEKAGSLSQGLWPGMIVAVAEQAQKDYQEQVMKAGVAHPTAVLESTILDSLVD